MNKKVKLLTGVAILGAAITGPPQSAQAVSYTVQLKGSSCVVGVAKLSSTKARALDIGCQLVQVRMQRYYASTIRTYYGPQTDKGTSEVTASHGTFAGCAAQVKVGGSFSGWYSC